MLLLDDRRSNDVVLGPYAVQYGDQLQQMPLAEVLVRVEEVPLFQVPSLAQSLRVSPYDHQGAVAGPGEDHLPVDIEALHRKRQLLEGHTGLKGRVHTGENPCDLTKACLWL
eukprot:scaffold652699_cov42-Prasinocladus_malaysianus.AAC.1